MRRARSRLSDGVDSYWLNKGLVLVSSSRPSLTERAGDDVVGGAGVVVDGDLVDELVLTGAVVVVAGTVAEGLATSASVVDGGGVESAWAPTDPEVDGVRTALLVGIAWLVLVVVDGLGGGPANVDDVVVMDSVVAGADGLVCSATDAFGGGPAVDSVKGSAEAACMDDLAVVEAVDLGKASFRGADGLVAACARPTSARLSPTVGSPD